MDLVFEVITDEDITELTHVMTRAFDDDTRKHLGVEKGGPEGYDDGEFFRRWLFSYDESRGFKILHQGRIIGGFIVWIYKHGKNVLGTIFVDPEHQDRGVGTRAWEFIEKTFPDTKSWKLDTPGYAEKNLYYYEKKCGFRKVKERETLEHAGTSLVYEKKAGE
jgi:GNAT superfamily N-acetyltransferase